MNDVNIKKESVVFANNNEAVMVFPSGKDKAEDIITVLDLKPYKAIILLLGGANSVDEKQVPQLAQLFGRGIARAAGEADAVIIDGGTQAGVMALMGEGVAGRGYKTTLIGVAPLHKITYPGSIAATETLLEPNHSHFVITEGKDWGSETPVMFNLLNALINKNEIVVADAKPLKKGPEKADAIPAIAVVVGGGPITKTEVLNVVRKNLPVIIVEGSGGCADEIAAACKSSQLPEEPVLAEIIADGRLHFHQVNNSVKGIERLIIREFGVDKVLMQAWETFADYDYNASIQQKKFDKIQMALLSIGVIGTALAVSQQIWGPRVDNSLKTASALFNKNDIGWWLVYYALILIPIIITVLVTAVNRFKQGSKWLLLRAGAESIKREIYRYRARAMYYSQDPEQELSKRVEDITRRTMRTEVNSTSLKPYNKDNGFPPYMFATQGGDDGFTYLNPDRYIEVRLTDQLNYFKKRSVQVEKQLRSLYWGTFIIGGIGTFLAAIGQQVWIALTTSVVAAFGTYLGYRQSENTLTKYNQAATDLANIRAWWNALSAEDQSLQKNIDSLVEHTEHVLQSELDGWVQQMQNALAELRKDQETTPEKEENKEPEESSKTAPPDTGKAAAANVPGRDENNTPAEKTAGKKGDEKIEPSIAAITGNEVVNESASDADDADSKDGDSNKPDVSKDDENKAEDDKNKPDFK